MGSQLKEFWQVVAAGAIGAAAATTAWVGGGIADRMAEDNRHKAPTAPAASTAPAAPTSQ